MHRPFIDPTRRLSVLWAFTACMALTTASAKEPMHYVYPQAESDADQRMNYYWELLEAVLDETTPRWGPYTLSATAKPMNSARSQVQLMASKEVQVIVRTTSEERETQMRAIRLPLDKGLTGYRLFLTRKAVERDLKAVKTLPDLRAFSVGQGVNWIDTSILRAAGLKVVTAPSYDALFGMLDAQRFDLFSRGINEIGPEYQQAKGRMPDLVIDRFLLLYYPLPRYYFFARTPEGDLLAQRVEEGLRMLMRNGKFERRYQAFKRLILSDLHLGGRRLIHIDNPYLSPETPLADADLWDNLDVELRSTR